MLEEAVSQSSSPTLWAVINSWLTPTVFFVVLQFVIATIYITSNIANTTNTNHENRRQQQLPRSPLQRLKSINFNSYAYKPQEPHLELHNAPPQEEAFHPLPQIPRSPTILQRLKSINLHNYFPTTPDAHESQSQKHHHLDDDSHETEEHQYLDDTAIVESDEADKGEEAGPSLDDIYSKILQGQERPFSRSHSDTTAAFGKSALSHFTEDDIVAVENRRPASVREGKVTAAVDSDRDDCWVDAKADDFINKFKQQLKLQRLDSVAR